MKYVQFHYLVFGAQVASETHHCHAQNRNLFENIELKKIRFSDYSKTRLLHKNKKRSLFEKRKQILHVSNLQSVFTSYEVVKIESVTYISLQWFNSRFVKSYLAFSSLAWLLWLLQNLKVKNSSISHTKNFQKVKCYKKNTCFYLVLGFSWVFLEKTTFIFHWCFRSTLNG